MRRTQLKTLSIAPRQQQTTLSKAQKAFNSLIKQIEKKRAQLAAWEAVVEPYQQKFTSELVPLLQTLKGLQREMVHCLDRASEQKGLSKTERRTIAGMLVELVAELLAEQDDAELKALYGKHCRSDYDSDQAEANAGMKAMFEDILGVELGDDFDPASPDEMLASARAKFEQARTADEAEAERRGATRKKSAKQLAREAQQEAEAQQLGQSIREVYRKLASALHPDRETDAAERERKTALMQRANQAYGKNNLLQLLELQLELEHIDQAAIDNIGEDRLKHYNKILKEQVAELDEEIFHTEGRFRAQFAIDPFAAIAPKTLERELARDIADVKGVIGDLKRDLLAFGDTKATKAWLKAQRRRAAKARDFDDMFW